MWHLRSQDLSVAEPEPTCTCACCHWVWFYDARCSVCQLYCSSTCIALNHQSPLLIRSIQWIEFIIVLLFWFSILRHRCRLSYHSLHLEDSSVFIWLSCAVSSWCFSIKDQRFSFLRVTMIIPWKCMLIWILVHMVLSRPMTMTNGWNIWFLWKYAHKIRMCQNAPLQSSAPCPSLQGRSVPRVETSGIWSAHDDYWGLR